MWPMALRARRRPHDVQGADRRGMQHDSAWCCTLQETLLYFPGERRSLVVAYILLFIGGIFGVPAPHTSRAAVCPGTEVASCV
jgi:hypothetical protein